jgi:protein-disulfide isomerase
MSMHAIPPRAAFGALLALAFVGLPGYSGCLAAAGPAGGDGVLAVVDGKPVTQAEVEEAAAEQFQALERDYTQKRYDLTEAWLDQLIEQKLIAAEAARLGSSEEEVVGAIETKPVSDADVDAFYEQNKARIRGPKEEMAPQIRQYLEQLNQQTARKDFIAGLRKRHGVDYRLEPLRVEVAATGPARGPANAPVTIVEFADFECPYCARILPTLAEVMTKYDDEVRLVYRHYPLSFHANAEVAARASLCAQEQGKFWELHDGMYANQKALAAEQLKATAAGLGLDAQAFNECLDSGRFADEVAADFAAGTAAGVSGTPVLFVNGRYISGAVPLEDITSVIDDELRRRGVAD